MIHEREVTMRKGFITDVYGNKYSTFAGFYNAHHHMCRLISVQKFIVSYLDREEFQYTFWFELNEEE